MACESALDAGVRLIIANMITMRAYPMTMILAPQYITLPHEEDLDATGVGGPGHRLRARFYACVGAPESLDGAVRERLQAAEKSESRAERALISASLRLMEFVQTGIPRGQGSARRTQSQSVRRVGDGYSRR
jgi:hypothetical protein